MKRKIGGLEGRGILLAEDWDDLPVYYTLSVWKEPFSPATSGEGKVWGEVGALDARVGGRATRLRLRGGDEVFVALVKSQGGGFVSFTTESAIPGYAIAAQN